MDSYRITLYLHLGLGVVALLTYWVAALATKGSRPHKLAGKVYLLAMIGLLVAAVPLSLGALIHYSAAFGSFLFYLLLITVTAIWKGWFAIRHKREFSRYAGIGFQRLAWANIAGGAAVLALGAATMQPIFLGFSLVGLLGGRSMLQLAARGPAHPRWWMQEHLGAMLGCGVATHIAFLSIGLPRLLPMFAGPALQTIAWLGPLVIASLAGAWISRGRGFSPDALRSNASGLKPLLQRQEHRG